MGPSQFLFLDINGYTSQEHKQELPNKVHMDGKLNVF